MSNYWNNKWAKAKDNWEERQVKSDSSKEVIAGLSTAGKRQYGMKAPKGSKDFHQLLKTGNVGKSVQLTGGAGSAQVASLLDVRGPDEYAQLMTVTLDFPSVVGLSPPTFASPFVAKNDGARAQVDFGVGGFQSTAFVDFGRGVSFTVPASYVRVNASREGTTGALVLLSVGAHISYGSINEHDAGQPTLTFVRPNAAPNGTSFDTIPPPFAVSMTPMFQDAAAGTPPAVGTTIGLQFFSRSGAFLGACRSVAENPASIPIPAETVRIRVFNDTGVSMNYSAIYKLGL